jgi:hypothetical protein
MESNAVVSAIFGEETEAIEKLSSPKFAKMKLRQNDL